MIGRKAFYLEIANHSTATEKIANGKHLQPVSQWQYIFC